MYIYFFDRYYGHDRVVQAELEGIAAGDLIEVVGYGYGLCLGEAVSWREQYTKYVEQIDSEVLILVPKLMSDDALQMLHWFTQHRFCTYKKAVGLWVRDPEEFAKRAPKRRKKQITKKQKMHTQKQQETQKIQEKSIYQTHIEQTHAYTRDSLQADITTFLHQDAQDTQDTSDISQTGQLLITFPDLWTIESWLSKDILSHASVILLHGKMTKKQLAESYRKIKTGRIHVILSTPSQIFYDRHMLKHIVIIDHHKRYYKNGQDPRYHVGAVVEQLHIVTGVSLGITGIALGEGE